MRFDSYAKSVSRRLPDEELIFRDFLGGNLRRALKDYIVQFIRRRMVTSYIQSPKDGEDYYFFPMHYMIDAQVTFRSHLQIKPGL